MWIAFKWMAASRMEMHEDPKGPRETAVAFMLSVSQGRDLRDLTQVPEKLMSVAADDKEAIVLTSPDAAIDDLKGSLVIYLEKKNGTWKFKDTKLETPNDATERLAAFLKDYPNAKQLPASVRQSVVAEGTYIYSTTTTRPSTSASGPAGK
jgi:hypothetical protein